MESTAIEKTIKDLLELLNVPYELEVVEDQSIGTTRFLIKTEEPEILIGRDGAHLAALSHIIKRISDKGGDPLASSGGRQTGGKNTTTSFVVDVNNYQGKLIDELKTKATMLAERARYFKSDVEMSPMSPYERMIVHSIFTNVKDIKTESLGEGKGRRVVIKYVATEE